MPGNTTGEPKNPRKAVTAVARALLILDCFKPGEHALGLSEIARRVNLHRTTVLRIARTMATAGYLAQLPNGVWRLGAACGWVGSRYNVALDAVIVEPLLRRVSRETGATVSYFVREDRRRICIARVDAAPSPPHHARVGQILPLNKGTTGAVLLAFSGEPGDFYEGIRKRGYHSRMDSPDIPAGSVACCPVVGQNGVLIGCISVWGARERFNQRAVAECIRVLREAAGILGYELSRHYAKRTVRKANPAKH